MRSPSASARPFHSSRRNATPLCSTSVAGAGSASSSINSATFPARSILRGSPLIEIVTTRGWLGPSLSTPARIRAPAAACDLRGRTIVRDLKLLRRTGVVRTRVRLHHATAHREMQIVASLTRVAAGFRMAACAHHRDPERQKRIAQRRRLTRAQHDSHMGKSHAQRADELHEIPVAERKARLKFPRAWTQPRQADRELRLPATPQQPLQMRRQRARLRAPFHEPKQRPNTDPPKAARVGALRAREPPVVVPLRPRRVQFRIRRTIVSLLINYEPLRTRGRELRVVRRLHGRDFERQPRHLRRECAHATFEVSARHKLRMFSRDEQQIAKTFLREMPRFLHHGVDFQSHAQYRIFA